jgi:hypothetical protein
MHWFSPILESTAGVITRKEKQGIGVSGRPPQNQDSEIEPKNFRPEIIFVCCFSFKPLAVFGFLFFGWTVRPTWYSCSRRLEAVLVHHLSGKRVYQDLHSGMCVIGIRPLNQLGCNIAQDAARDNKRQNKDANDKNE